MVKDVAFGNAGIGHAYRLYDVPHALCILDGSLVRVRRLVSVIIYKTHERGLCMYAATKRVRIVCSRNLGNILTTIRQIRVPRQKRVQNVTEGQGGRGRGRDLYKANLQVFQEFWKDRVLGKTMHGSVPCDDSLEITKDLMALTFARFLPKLGGIVFLIYTTPKSNPITRLTLDLHTSFFHGC